MENIESGRLSFLAEELGALRGRGLYRSLKTVSGPQGPEVILDGRRALMFSSNDYLGLAGDHRLREAASRAAAGMGAGAGASRLISGHMEIHRDLERELADLKGCEDALLFPTGYMANLGVLSSLVGRGDAILSDELNHASLIDGCRLSRAETLVYRHGDMGHLDKLLRSARGARRRLVCTDSLFSMDGDFSPLPEIVELSEKYDALVMIDEAHATGVVGRTGRGAIEHFDLFGRIDVVMGTLGKALGSFGAFVAGSRLLREFLLNRSRSFIYTTATSPPTAAAALAAVKILKESPALPERLRENSRRLRRALSTLGFETGAGSPDVPIIPIIIGDAERTVRFAEALLERGVFAHAIRPPTVPEGTSRIRVAVMAAHTPEMLGRAAAAFAEAGVELGLIPRKKAKTAVPAKAISR